MISLLVSACDSSATCKAHCRCRRITDRWLTYWSHRPKAYFLDVGFKYSCSSTRLQEWDGIEHGIPMKVINFDHEVGSHELARNVKTALPRVIQSTVLQLLWCHQPHICQPDLHSAEMRSDGVDLVLLFSEIPPYLYQEHSGNQTVNRKFKSNLQHKCITATSTTTYGTCRLNVSTH